MSPLSPRGEIEVEAWTPKVTRSCDLVKIICLFKSKAIDCAQSSGYGFDRPIKCVCIVSVRTD